MDKQIIRGAIVTKFGSQCVAAKELGINERRLSRLINGHDRLKPEEAKTLRSAFGVDYFGESEEPRPAA